MDIKELQALIFDSKPEKQKTKEFAQLIIKERQIKWPTAKTFWEERKEYLGCSYNRYAVVESGSAKPSLELARKIINELEIDEPTALYAWVRDLMPDNVTKSYFTDPLSTENIAKYQSQSITPEQSKLFKAMPVANEMASYISVYSHRGVTLKELRQVFNMSSKDVNQILKQLIYTNVIVLNGKNQYEVPKEAWINIPDLEEYRETRVRNFGLSIDSHFSSSYIEDVTIEQATFRILSPKQIATLRRLARSIARWLSAMPDDYRQGVPYRFFCGGNICKFGNNKLNITPRERGIRID